MWRLYSVFWGCAVSNCLILCFQCCNLKSASINGVPYYYKYPALCGVNRRVHSHLRDLALVCLRTSNNKCTGAKYTHLKDHWTIYSIWFLCTSHVPACVINPGPGPRSRPGSCYQRAMPCLRANRNHSLQMQLLSIRVRTSAVQSNGSMLGFKAGLKYIHENACEEKYADWILVLQSHPFTHCIRNTCTRSAWAPSLSDVVSSSSNKCN